MARACPGRYRPRCRERVSSTPSTAPSTEAEAAPSLLRRAGTAIPVALLAGAILGALAWLSDDLGYPTGLLIPANLVGVWGLVAFGAGAGARIRPRRRGSRAVRAARRGRRVLPRLRAARRGVAGRRGRPGGDDLGLRGAARRAHARPRRQRVAAPRGDGPQPRRSPCPRACSSPRGCCSAPRCANDPAARSLLTVEALVGLALPLFLVRGMRARAIALERGGPRRGRDPGRAAGRAPGPARGRRHVLAPRRRRSGAQARANH